MTIARYRQHLPQLDGAPMLTDSGLETSLIYHEGFDLPDFAAFVLLRSASGLSALRRYYQRHVDIAAAHRVGFILDTPTWRASSDWGKRLGFDSETLDAFNRDAVSMMVDWRDQHDSPETPYLISGNIGPRGDGYDPDNLMTPDEAECYHANQVLVFGDAGVDMITAITMTHAGEAIGLVRVAERSMVPIVIGFTVELDGRLPTGQTLADAIDEVDSATNGGAAYFVINCAHPDHFRHAVSAASSWQHRIRGLRANASRKSHAELDESTELDDGDPVELGADYAAMQAHLPNLCVFGGCCGTDHRHIAAIASRCLPDLANTMSLGADMIDDAQRDRREAV